MRIVHPLIYTALMITVGIGLRETEAADDNIRSRNSNPNTLFHRWAKTISAGTVVDKTLLDNTLARVRVTETFWGEQDIEYLYVKKDDPLILPGKRILVAVYYPSRTEVLVDTAENRKILLQAIEDRNSPKVRGFIDVPALLQEAEKILLSYIKEISNRVPDHPHLGMNAIDRIQVQHSKAPLGIYICIMEEYNWMRHRNRAMMLHPLPDNNGIVFWVAAALDNFMVGHPLRPRHQAFLGRTVSMESDERTGYYQSSSRLPSGVLQLDLQVYYIISRENNELEKAMREEFFKLRERQNRINRNPPRDIDAAIAIIIEYSRERQDQPTLHGAVLPKSFEGLACAYQALLSQYARDNLSTEQKHILVPLLINLLVDTTMVENHSPADGPIILSHHQAYIMLTNITGIDLPPPLSQKQFGGRGPITIKPTIVDYIKQKQDADKRHMAWKDWWKAQNEDVIPNKPSEATR